MSEELRLALPAEFVDGLAQAIATRLGNQPSSPWMSAQEAAVYLRCPLSRIRKLTLIDALPTHRDGSRVLYRRDELDEYIRGGGSKSP